MTLQWTHPVLGVIVALLAAAAIVVAWRRQVAMDWRVGGMLTAAACLAALAAGTPRWMRPDPTPVAVMVDLSPSTRGAAYRQPEALAARIAQLLGSRPYRLIYFAEHATESLAEGVRELPATRTVYGPPADVPAVVLFSDGRFELPAVAPPTFAVIDAGLIDPQDSAVRRLEVRGGRVQVDLNVGAEGRTARFTGAQTDGEIALSPPGERLSLAVDPAARSVEVALNGADRWPENDAMRVQVIPQAASPWWVGDRPAPQGYEAIAPSQLPSDPAAYLAASAIVLDNVPASALGAVAQQRLGEFVRDLGGALIVVGGDRSFAAGGYATAPLEGLLPLGSLPPRPTIHWVLLVDASGSMDEPAGEGAGTRWQRAVRALERVREALPAEDLVSVGGFARDLRWWINARPVREARAVALPPAEVHPSGPTNLEAALLDLSAMQGTEAAGSRLPTRALVITDAESKVTAAAAVTRRLEQAGVRLNVLLIDQRAGAATLRQIASETGGVVRTELDPRAWAQAAREMMRSAGPDYLQRRPVTVTYLGALSDWPTLAVALWNRTWLKPGATLLAQTSLDGQALAMVARWQRGLGTVLAGGYAAPLEQVTRWVDALQRPPDDPRYAVDLERDERGWRVVVKTALEAAGRAEALVLVDGLTPHAMETVAPGVFEVTLPPQPQPRVVRVRPAQGDAPREVRRVALPGSYPPEFDGVGLDLERLSQLAERTGGQVIAPTWRAPVELPASMRPWPLAPLLSVVAATLLAAALVTWRRGS